MRPGSQSLTISTPGAMLGTVQHSIGHNMNTLDAIILGTLSGFAYLIATALILVNFTFR